MKIIDFTIGKAGQEAPEGWLILGYSDIAHGGRTEIGAMVKRKPDGALPTWDEVAALMSSNINGRNEWPNDIRTGKVSGNVLRLAVPDGFDPIAFSAGWNPSLDQSAKVEQNPDFVKIEEQAFN